jgi:hypothetical protein
MLKSILEDEIEEMSGFIHSCVTLDIKDHILLFDEENIYKYSILPKSKGKKQYKVYEEHKCTGVYPIDVNYCYALAHKSEQIESGLRLYDLHSITTKHKATNLSLHSV